MISIAHRLSGRPIALSGTHSTTGAAWAAERYISAPTSWARIPLLGDVFAPSARRLGDIVGPCDERQRTTLRGWRVISPRLR
jgi:hypothetical protein